MPSVVFADIPKAAVHNGGRIAFGRDDLLYVTTGDAGERRAHPTLGIWAARCFA
jgi:glucose/arabinose dehydrogenase